MKKPILALVPSAYKTSTLFLPIPTSGEADMSFSRSTTATRLRKDGLVETVPVNVPRLDYLKGNCPTLLLEASSTNHVPYSQPTAGGQGWTTNLSPVSSYNTDIAPDGTKTAQSYETNATSEGKYLTTTIANLAGEYWTASFFVKSKSGFGLIETQFTGTGINGTKIFQWDVKNGLIISAPTGGTSTIEYYGNGWYRLNATYLADFDGSLRSAIYANGDSPQTYLWWGAQLEKSSCVTSYIPTFGSAVTRNTDNCTNALSSTLYNGMEHRGSLYFSFYNIIDRRSFKSLSLSNSSTSNRVLFRQNGASDITAYILNSTGTKTALSYSISSGETFFKVCLTWEQDSCVLYVNGAKITQDLTVDLTSNLPYTDFSFDGGGNGGDLLTARYKEVKIYNEVLTEAEAIELTR